MSPNDETSPEAMDPKLAAAVGAMRIRDAAQAMLVYHCATCTGTFAEPTAEGVLARAAANRHGFAITPELESITRDEETALRLLWIRSEADRVLKYHCDTCTGAFDESTVEGVLKRAAANAHGEAITPELEVLRSAA